MNKHLSRLMAASLALVLIFGTIACNGDTQETDAPTTTEQQTETPEETETSEETEAPTEGVTESETTDGTETPDEGPAGIGGGHREEGQPTNNVDNSERYPLERDASLTYWVQPNSSVTALFQNLGETPLYQEYVERTGIDVTFQHPSVANAAEALSLLLTTGEYPDIIEYNWLGFAGGPSKAIQDGILIELNDVIEEYAPNLTALFESRPEFEQMVQTDEGSHYVFPFLQGHDNLLVASGIIIREDWLNELGLEMPETMEEWEHVLTRFRDDMGAQAPLAITQGHIEWGQWTNPFGVMNGFYRNDEGEVRYGAVEEGYKEFLETFNRWYQEGLLDPDHATLDNDQMRAKMTSGRSGVAMGYMASGIGNWTDAARETNPDYLLAGTPIPVMNPGDPKRFSSRNFNYIGGGSAGITTSADDVEAAALFLDYGYSNEGHILFNFGIEGESFDWDDNYPKYKDELYNDPDHALNIVLGQYLRASYSGPFVQDERYIEQYVPLPEQQEAYMTWADTEAGDYRMPPITATPEESSELATIMNDINDERDRMYLAYLFGDESLDNFDQYVESLYDLGLERAIEIQEAALERYNNR